MTRVWCLLLLTAPFLSAQSGEQTLQLLLQELRQFRQEIRGMSLVSQRIQILLYRVQLQEEATRRATQRHDQANAKVREAERVLAEQTGSLRTLEEKLAALQNPNERASLEHAMQQLKRSVEVWARDKDVYQVAELTAGSDLKVEQGKLSELQQRLDQLEQQLTNYAAPSPAR
jgi:hypothetical protein